MTANSQNDKPFPEIGSQVAFNKAAIDFGMGNEGNRGVILDTKQKRKQILLKIRWDGSDDFMWINIAWLTIQ